VIFYCFN